MRGKGGKTSKERLRRETRIEVPGNGRKQEEKNKGGNRKEYRTKREKKIERK